MILQFFLTSGPSPSVLFFLRSWDGDVSTATLTADFTSIPQANFQSGFKARQSTGTAFLSILNYLLLTVDFGNSSSSILLSHPKTCVGIRGTPSEVVTVLPLEQECLCPTVLVFIKHLTSAISGATGFYPGPLSHCNIYAATEIQSRKTQSLISLLCQWDKYICLLTQMIKPHFKF